MRYTWWGLFAVVVLLYTPNTSFYCVSLLIITKLDLSQNIWIDLVVIFCNTTFRCRQVHVKPHKRVDHWQKSNSEIWGIIRSRTIVVREIMTLLQIVWLQLFLVNTLLWPPSVRNYLWTKLEVFSIAIVDLISRRALVGFSLLRGRYYYNLTGLIW